MNKLAKIAIGAVTGAVIAGVGMKIINTAAIKKKEEEKELEAEKNEALLRTVERTLIKAEKKKNEEVAQQAIQLKDVKSMTSEQLEQSISVLEEIGGIYIDAMALMYGFSNYEDEKILKIEALIKRNRNMISNRIECLNAIKESKAV